MSSIEEKVFPFVSLIKDIMLIMVVAMQLLFMYVEYA
jgi:hypothetical protein